MNLIVLLLITQTVLLVVATFFIVVATLAIWRGLR